MRLAGRVAAVTGGTIGLGRAIVERFCREGAVVFFSGRREELGREVARLSGATYVAADVAIEADAKRTIDTAARHNGRLDVLVNNAGNAIGGGGRLEQLSLDDFDRTLAVHLRGALAHAKYATALMRAQAEGSIVNIGSVAGHRAGYAPSLGYSVAKAALIHLTRCPAMELGEAGIRVNSSSPGGIATGIFGKAFGLDDARAEATAPELRATLASSQAIPRAGLPQDIASAALFLASTEAGFITGEDLVVDGGLIWGRRRAEAAVDFRHLRELLGPGPA